MDYTKPKLEVPKLYKRSDEYNFDTDITSMNFPFGDIFDKLFVDANEAYDDLLIESFNVCGIDKDTLMKNRNKIMIHSLTDMIDSTKTYDKIYYDGKLIFRIVKDLDYSSYKITMEVEFL